VVEGTGRAYEATGIRTTDALAHELREDPRRERMDVARAAPRGRRVS
jgi:hypothetical protein